MVIVAVLILWLLFTPFIIEVNSQEKLYRMRLFGVGSGRLEVTPSLKIFLVIRFMLWKWSRLIFPFKPRSKKPVQKAEKKSKFSFRKTLRLLKAFNLKYLKVNLDTGDDIINAYLFPVFGMLSRKNRILRINFEGVVDVSLHIRSNIAKMIYKRYM